jgi:hypothetical protein
MLDAVIEEMVARNEGEKEKRGNGNEENQGPEWSDFPHFRVGWWW